MTTRNMQLHSLALAGILTFGATIVLLVVGIMTGKVIVNRWCQNKISEQLMILPDGMPVVATGEADRDGPVCRGLDGGRVKTRADYYGSVWPRTANPPCLASQVDLATPFRELKWSQRLTRFFNNYSYSYNDGMSWYFVHDGKAAGHGYFVGFDNKTKLKIGYIGRNGACVEQPTVDEQFAVNGRRMAQPSIVFFVSRYDESADAELPEIAAMLEKHGRLPSFTIPFIADDGLMLVNFKEQTVKCLRKDDDLISATRTATNATEGKKDAIALDVLLLRSPDRVRMVDMKGREIRSYPLSAKLQDRKLQWQPLPDSNILVRPGGWEWDDELYWLDPKGNVVRHELVKVEKHWELDGLRKNIPLSLIAPSPATIAVMAACGSWSSLDDPPSTWYWRSLRRAFTEGWVPYIIAALSIVSAVLCYRRQRRYAMPWTVAWVVFVFLTGVPGYIGYLAHRVWPARLACPHCGRQVPRDRAACFACKREFPAPAAKGIEVFA
jgi:hypothetical protein